MRCTGCVWPNDSIDLTPWHFTYQLYTAHELQLLRIFETHLLNNSDLSQPAHLGALTRLLSSRRGTRHVQLHRLLGTDLTTIQRKTCDGGGGSVTCWALFHAPALVGDYAATSDHLALRKI